MASAELTQDRQEQLDKTSASRLRQVIIEHRGSEENVESMDRPALKEAVAQQKTAATQRDVASEIELKKMDFVMKKMEMEMEERRQERGRRGTERGSRKTKRPRWR